ncbi:hypothetical protein SASPL_130705 [Salvia splendens]|uniref:Large ribosomal subunit protein uL11 C-terminal domain-containing protein n=1 Tax=Salvia splendens TaxID=180675 RepID=A0A8X8X6J7_SALSN|nr:hypothetical protein SASPL_130705 [Salvia splendens]
MDSSSLCAYNAPISISSRNFPTSKKFHGEAESKLPISTMFSSLSLSSNQTTTLQFLSEKRPLRLSSTPITLTVIAMAPPKPGGKAKKVMLQFKFDKLIWGKTEKPFSVGGSGWVGEAGSGGGEGDSGAAGGPALGAKGVNIAAFCKDYNARTLIRLVISFPSKSRFSMLDRSFTFILKTPPASVLLLKAAGAEKGSQNPKQDKVGKVTIDQLRQLHKKNCQISTVQVWSRR